MSKLVFFCAGASLDTLPAAKVENILVNVPDSMGSERAIRDTKTMFKYAGTEARMLDSGGYQILKAEEQSKKMTFDPGSPLIRSKERINIAPRHVVEAACKLRPTIMTALDLPIRELLERTDQEKEFPRKLRFNVKWAFKTASLREKQCPHIQLFIPVQCYNLDHFEVFRNSIKSIQYDGLSLPIRNLKLSELALFLLRFYQVGIRKVHILGSSSFFTIAFASLIKIGNLQSQYSKS